MASSRAVSGYTGGTVANPTYEQVSQGQTRHLEAVQVYYDPQIISYEELLEVYWRSIDPTDYGGQFFDRGSQYKTDIFYHDETQRELATKAKNDLDLSGRFSKPVVTKVLEFKVFYKAEEYHQDYYRKTS